MLPTSFKKICCDVQTCPRRNQEKEDAAPANSSIEEMTKCVGSDKDTQISLVATSPSVQTLIPTSEYETMCISCRKRLKNKHRRTQTLDGLKSLAASGQICGLKSQKQINPAAKLEIPLEIRLEIFCEFLLPSSSSAEYKRHPRSTQTLGVHCFDKGFMSQSWGCIRKPEVVGHERADGLKSQSNPSNTISLESLEAGPTSSCLTTELDTKIHKEDQKTPVESPVEESLERLKTISSVCDCGREQLAMEEYGELMKAPNAKLFPLLCENKLKCACNTEQAKPDVMSSGRAFRLALPQHKDLDICVKCRYDPSPLLDDDGLVFCPGNCGCCLCPWKPRAKPSLEDVLLHSKFKVCKCRNRMTVFTGMEKYASHCSQVSYFDICPCREKAEAKHLELFGCEMADGYETLRRHMDVEGIFLEDVKEIQKTAEKSTEAYFNRNYENIRSCLNKFCTSNSSETSPTESQMSEKSQSWHLPQPPTRRLPRCTCKKLTTSPSSSCSSLSSEYLQKPKFLSKQNRTECRIQSLQRTPTKRVNIALEEVSRTPLLQVETPKKAWEVFPGFEKLATSLELHPRTDYFFENSLNNVVTYSEEQFYSCSSEDSESDEKPDNLFGSQIRCNSDKNYAILQLLREVENLIHKDDPMRKAVEAEEAQSSPARLSSEVTAQESLISRNLNDKISKPTSTTQLNALLWPPQPQCFCNCRAHVPPNNFSFFPPFNLTSPALDCTPIPEPFAYEENSSGFKRAASDNEIILTADQLAPNPLQYEYNGRPSRSSPAAARDIRNDASMQTSESLCMREDIGTEMDAFNNQNSWAEIDSFKDCSSGKNSLLAAGQLPDPLAGKYICKQIILEDRGEVLTLTCFPVGGSKKKDLANLTVADPCQTCNSFENQVSVDSCQGSLASEEYVDEDIHKIFTAAFEDHKPNADSLLEYDDEEPVLEKLANEVDCTRMEELLPSEVYQPCSDCLIEYEDEEPSYKNSLETEAEVNKEVEHFALEKLSESIESISAAEPEMFPDPIEFVEEPEKLTEPIDLTADLEIFPDPVKLTADREAENDADSLANGELKELVKSEENADTEKLSEPGQSIGFGQQKMPQAITKQAEKPVEESDHASPDLNEEKTPSFSICSAPDIDQHRNSKQPVSNEYVGEEDHELAKEKLAEDRNRKQPDGNDDRTHDNEMVLFALKQAEANSCSAEMKFFIDSLIVDLEAMEFARRRSQFEKNICRPKKLVNGVRDSFPVTITDVTELGANSLYVKWKIHDCLGIAGYEIYTDGYLTNRFYNRRHDAAVVAHVDVTLPHRIALVAQPEAADANLDDNCNTSRRSNTLKSLAWTTADKGRRPSSLALWTPSIFLYDPISVRAPPTRHRHLRGTMFEK